MKRPFVLFLVILLIAIVSAEPKKKSKRVSPTPAPNISSIVEQSQTSSTPSPSPTADTHGFPKKIIGISNPHNGEVIVLKPKFFFLRDKFENIKDYFPTSTNQTVVVENQSGKKDSMRRKAKPQNRPVKVRPEMIENSTVRPETVATSTVRPEMIESSTVRPEMIESSTVRRDTSFSNQEVLLDSSSVLQSPFKRGPNRVVIRRRPVPRQRYRIIVLDPHTHVQPGLRLGANQQFRRRPFGYQPFLRRRTPPVQYGYI